MQIEAIPMLLNSDFMNVPLDVKMHLADYKMYGEDSYVFQQKELLHGLYECTYLSMNDRELAVEAFVYLLENNKHIGEVFSNINEIGNKDILKGLRTMQAVAASSTAMQAVLASSTAMQAVLASSTAMQAVLASSTAMQAVAASSTAMQAVLASSTAMQAVLASSTAMQAVAASSTAMSAILNSPNCMLLQNTGLPGSRGDNCYGKFLLVGSKYPTGCIDSCTPDYKSYINAGYKLTIQSPKFGTVYTKIGVPNVPANTIFTMLNDYSSGDYCIVYRL